MENVVATMSEIVNAVKSYDIAFPHLGIFIRDLQNSIKIGNFSIAFYGIIIALAMVLAFSVVISLAKKTKQNEDYYYDIFIIVIIAGIVGARAYYVLFNLDYYTIRPYEILDIRAGGLAVFGGIILSIIAVFIYCLIRKCNFFRILDTTVCGLALGQAIGRFGNFFNMEAFGTYTDNLLAMRMRYDHLDPSTVDMTAISNLIEENGIQYIQAHPTFFYESMGNLVLFIILLVIFNKTYKFRGQIFATYLIGYGIIRSLVESLRTDSLMIMGTDYRVSQLVAILCVIIGLLIYILYFAKKIKPFDKNEKDTVIDKKVDKKVQAVKENKNEVITISNKEEPKKKNNLKKETKETAKKKEKASTKKVTTKKAVVKKPAKSKTTKEKAVKKVTKKK